MEEVIVAGRRGPARPTFPPLTLRRRCRRRFTSVSLSSVSSNRISRGEPRRELNRYHLFAIPPEYRDFRSRVIRGGRSRRREENERSCFIIENLTRRKLRSTEICIIL